MVATLYSVSVYFLTMLIMVILSALSNSNKNHIPILAIFVFAVVFGVRYNVGIDHLAYLEMYQSCKLGGFEIDTEPAFGAMIKLFSYLGCHFSIFFFALAFLQLYLIFYSLRNFPKLHVLVIITFFLVTTYLNFMNGIRQEIAFCFWAVSVEFLSRKKILGYFISLFLAMSFHFSAIILFPIYFLYVRRDSYFNNVKMQLAITFIAVALYFVFGTTNLIFGLVAELAKMMGYYGYVGMVIEGNTEFLEASRGIGLGFYIIFVLNFIIILLSDKVKDFYKSRHYNILYDLYFFGVVYMYLTNGSIALQRINYYFYNFNFIIGAFTLYYLMRHKTLRNTLVTICMFSLYVLLFAAIVVYRGEESCAIYQTFWNL